MWATAPHSIGVRRSMFPNDWTEDHGDRLFREGRASKTSPASGWVVLGLLALCLIPRLWAGMLHDVLCPDAVLYIKWTEALEKGDVARAFHYTGLNIYQPLLLALKSLPGDWLALAKWWSVTMAALAVLPIYGWLRRQFNESLALLGCGFYALHPAMIHDSPLIIRDPTFWFLFSLALYVTWRAVSELRYRWFVSLAIVFGLMIHLRTEGWLLVPILLVWVTFRLRHAKGKRIRIASATSLALAAGPIIGFLIQQYVFTQPGDQIVGDSRHLDRVGELTGGTGVTPISAVLDGTIRIVVRSVKAFGYLPLSFALAGLMHWRSRLLGPSKAALLLFCVLSFGAIWASFCLTEMDRRYTYPTVIASLPTIAAGLCLVATWCSQVANRSRRLHRRDFSFWLLNLAAASCLILSITILVSPRPLLRDQADIGQWLRARFGARQSIAANLTHTRLLAFYSGSYPLFRAPPSGPCETHPLWFTDQETLPVAILIWLDWPNPAGVEPFEPGILAAKELGYKEISADELPETCRKILVLVREELD